MKKSGGRLKQTEPVPPPARDGVSASCVVLPEGPWSTILEFLTQRFPGVTTETWITRMNAGDVVDPQGAPIRAQHLYQSQLRLYYYRAVAVEPRIPFEEVVLFQDDFLVVVDKPHFLPVIPSGRYLQETLLVRLKRKLGLDTLAPIHRIDRETAGVVVFTIQPSTRGSYQDLFVHKTVRKHYEAIAPWRPELNLPLTYRSRLEDHGKHFMQVREAEGEPNSETQVELMEVEGKSARYRLSPITGRKHQLRAHCAALGIPIYNDRIYPKLLAENSDDYANPLQLLAKSIAFRDPISGLARSFTSARTLSLRPSVE